MREPFACVAAGDTACPAQYAANVPAASPTAHSAGWTRYAPPVRCVAPRFLQAAIRFVQSLGTSARAGLKWADVDAANPRRSRRPVTLVDVDAVVADAARVREVHRRSDAGRGTIRDGDVLLEDAHQRFADAARLADVGLRRGTVRAAEDVLPNHQVRIAGAAAVIARRGGLQPVEVGEGDLTGVLDDRRIAGCVAGRDDRRLIIVAADVDGRAVVA